MTGVNAQVSDTMLISGVTIAGGNSALVKTTSTGGITAGAAGGFSTAGSINAVGSGNISASSSGNINQSGSGNIALTGSGQAQVYSTSTSATPLIVKPTGTIVYNCTSVLTAGPGTTQIVLNTLTGLYAGATITLSGFQSGNSTPWTILSVISGNNSITFTSSGVGTFQSGSTVNFVGSNATNLIAVQDGTGATLAGISPLGAISGSGAGITALSGANITATTIPTTALATTTGTVSGGSVVLDTNASLTTPTINYGALTFPIISSLVYSTQPTATTISSTSTLTSAQIFTGILTSATASAWTSTLPSITTAVTGLEAYWTSLNNGIAPPVNTCFDISFINTGTTNAWTITIPTGWTGVPATTWTINAAPSATIPTSVRARIVKRSTTAYSIFRLS
jgi:hypothetical protein